MQYIIEPATLDYSSFDRGFRYRTCPDCNGRGQEVCDICNGTGRLDRPTGEGPFLKTSVDIDDVHESSPRREKRKCLFCNGTGKEECKKCWGTGEYVSSILGGGPCPYCSATGKSYCSECHGKGYKWKKNL